MLGWFELLIFWVGGVKFWPGFLVGGSEFLEYLFDTFFSVLQAILLYPVEELFVKEHLSEYDSNWPDIYLVVTIYLFGKGEELRKWADEDKLVN